jgi:mannose-6-phosphate isomerase
MGTHHLLPSFEINESSITPLSNRIGKLPFLYKVLSVNKPLSIQAHPTKDVAIKLHAADPTHYPDDNHKPEMCLSLSEFKCLIGFKKRENITKMLLKHPPFELLIKKNTITNFYKTKNLKQVIQEIITNQDIASINKCITELLKCNDDVGSLVKYLNSYFPNDIGVVFACFMNFYCLRPGESLMIGPNIPHCYVYGECIECMANSDNVIRCGLTPKFKDIPTLLNILDFTMGNYPRVSKMEINQNITYYPSTCIEFSGISKLAVNGKINLRKSKQYKVCIILEGSGVVSCSGKSYNVGKYDIFMIDKEVGCILEGNMTLYFTE